MKDFPHGIYLKKPQVLDLYRLQDVVAVTTASPAATAAFCQCRACVDSGNTCEACQANLETIAELKKYAKWLEEQIRLILNLPGAGNPIL